MRGFPNNENKDETVFLCVFGGVLSLLFADLPEELGVLLISKWRYCSTDGRIDG